MPTQYLRNTNRIPTPKLWRQHNAAVPQGCKYLWEYIKVDCIESISFLPYHPTVRLKSGRKLYFAKKWSRLTFCKKISFLPAFHSLVLLLLLSRPCGISETVSHRFGNLPQNLPQPSSAKNHFNLPSPGSSLSVSNLTLEKITTWF